MTQVELERIRKDWKIDNPNLAVNEQITINNLLDEIEWFRKVIGWSIEIYDGESLMAESDLMRTFRDCIRGE